MAAIFAGTVGITGNQPLSRSVDFNVSGVTGGLQAGYNWQVHPSWVIGVETDFNFSGVKGDGSVSSLYEAGRDGRHHRPKNDQRQPAGEVV